MGCIARGQLNIRNAIGCAFYFGKTNGWRNLMDKNTAKCQLQNWLATGGKFKIPFRNRIKNRLKKIPGLLKLKQYLTKSIANDNYSSKYNVPSNIEILGLQEGEWIQVRTAQEIQTTLNENNVFDGLVFLQGMWKHCGKKYQIFKRVERILDYKNSRMVKLKNIVFLKGIYCQDDPSELIDCDQTCFYYWKEAWLRRIN